MGILRVREYPFPHEIDVEAASMADGFAVSGSKVAALGLGLPLAILDTRRGVARIYDIPGTVYEGESPLHALMALSRDTEVVATGARLLIEGCTRCAVLTRIDVPWDVLGRALAKPGTVAEERGDIWWRRALCSEDGVCVCIRNGLLCALDTATRRGVGFWPAEREARYWNKEARQRHEWFLFNAPWRRSG